MSHPASSLQLKSCLGMRVSGTPFTPKLMHMSHNFAQSIVMTVFAAEADASVSSSSVYEYLTVAHRPCLLLFHMASQQDVVMW